MALQDFTYISISCNFGRDFIAAHLLQATEAAIHMHFYEKMFWKYAANLQEKTLANLWFQ